MQTLRVLRCIENARGSNWSLCMAVLNTVHSCVFRWTV